MSFEYIFEDRGNLPSRVFLLFTSSGNFFFFNGKAKDKVLHTNCSLNLEVFFKNFLCFEESNFAGNASMFASSLLCHENIAVRNWGRKQGG